MNATITKVKVEIEYIYNSLAVTFQVSTYLKVGNLSLFMLLSNKSTVTISAKPIEQKVKFSFYTGSTTYLNKTRIQRELIS